MAIPIYACVLTEVVVEFVNIQENISLNVQDLFSFIANVIKICVILYFLYISKFYNIYVKYDIEKSYRSSLDRKSSRRSNNR